MRSSLEPIFYREKRPNSVSLSSQDRFSNPLVIFMALLWSLSSLSTSSLNCVWWPEWDTVLQVQPNKHCIEWEDYISIFASKAPVDSAQYLTCLCCCHDALLTHVQLVVPQEPRSFSARLLPSHVGPSLYWALWLFCPRCRTLRLSLLNFILLLNYTAFSTNGWIWAGLKKVFLILENMVNGKAQSH